MLKAKIAPSDERDFTDSGLNTIDSIINLTKIVFEDDEKHICFLYVQNKNFERWGLDYISANSIMEYSNALEKYEVTIDDAPYQNDLQRHPHKCIELKFCFEKDDVAESVYKRYDQNGNFAYIIRQDGDGNRLPSYYTCNVYEDYFEANCPFRANIEIKAYCDEKLMHHEYTKYLSSGVCIAVPVMTHNEYGLFIHDRNSKAQKGEITWDEYFNSRQYIKISDYDLEKFNLSDEDKKTINEGFNKEVKNAEDMILLQGFSEECEGFDEATKLGLVIKVCGFRGYYVNDEKLMVLSYAEGELFLKIYTDKNKYRAEIKRLEKFYQENDC